MVRELVGAVVFGLATLSSSLFAQSESLSFSQTGIGGTTELSLFAGFGGGYSDLQGDNFDGDSHGRHVHVFGLVSPRWGKWFGDVGLGWQQSRVKGHTEKNEVFDMITQSPMVEFFPSIGFWDHWQVGPLAAVLFGTDHHYGVETEAANQMVMWGPRISYEWRPEPEWRMRAYAETLRESTLQERQLVNVTIGLMVGIPVATRTSAAVAETKSAGNETTDVTVTLDPELVFFSTASSEIKPQVKRVLEDVAKRLAEQQVAWESMDVMGHADQRGSKEYNMVLSEKRARAVGDQLFTASIERAKVRTQYFGKEQLRDPANNPKAWALNRRVELVFHGVKEPEKLQAILKPLEKIEPEFERK